MSPRWGRRNSGIALTAVFLLSVVVHTWASWIVFKAIQQTHGEPGNVLGPNGYLWQWAAATAQLIAYAALTGFLVWRLGPAGRMVGAGEATGETGRPLQGELGQTLRRIEGQLAELARAQHRSSGRQVAEDSAGTSKAGRAAGAGSAGSAGGAASPGQSPYASEAAQGGGGDRGVRRTAGDGRPKDVGKGSAGNKAGQR